MSSAIARFAPRTKYDEYAGLYAKFCASIPPDMVRPTPIDHVQAPLAHDPVIEFQKFAKLNDELKNWIIDELRTGKFQAIAFPKIRIRNVQLVRLNPSDWVEGQYSWDGDELWIGQQVYNEIRILPAETAKIPKKGMRGRTPYEKEISAAAAKLKEQRHGKEFPNLRASFPDLRKLLWSDNPHIDFKGGPSDSTLYKVLSDLSIVPQSRKDSKKSA